MGGRNLFRDLQKALINTGIGGGSFTSLRKRKKRKGPTTPERGRIRGE